MLLKKWPKILKSMHKKFESVGLQETLIFFVLPKRDELILFLQGSTVNMNIMQPIYKYVANSGHKGYECLGIVLFVGKFMDYFGMPI